jgi:molybdenum cofactor guanylyltransferase
MGRPKAWLELDGEALLTRVTRVLGTVVAPVIVVAAKGQDLPPLPEQVIVAHDEITGCGPLAGLAIGLAVAASHAETAFVCATDAPFLDPAFVGRLAELRGSHDVVAPRVDGRVHPLAAIYACRMRSTVSARLSRGELRMTALLEALDTRYVDRALLLEGAELMARDPTLRSLENVNTEADYARTRSDPRTTP